MYKKLMFILIIALWNKNDIDHGVLSLTGCFHWVFFSSKENIPNHFRLSSEPCLFLGFSSFKAQMNCLVLYDWLP